MSETLAPHPIKRVIRHKATGLYLVEGGSGTWVESPGAATKYTTIRDMVEICRQYGLEDVELVYKLDQGMPVGTMAGDLDEA
jgi:hypothetical protein